MAIKQRAFINVPFCHERCSEHKQSETVDYEKIKKFYDVLQSIDKFYNSEDFSKNKFNGKNNHMHVWLIKPFGLFSP